MDWKTVFGGMISRSYDSLSIGRQELVEKVLSFVKCHFELRTYSSGIIYPTLYERPPMPKPLLHLKVLHDLHEIAQNLCLLCEGPPEVKASRLLFRSISSFMIRS